MNVDTASTLALTFWSKPENARYLYVERFTDVLYVAWVDGPRYVKSARYPVESAPQFIQDAVLKLSIMPPGHAPIAGLGQRRGMYHYRVIMQEDV